MKKFMEFKIKKDQRVKNENSETANNDHNT